MNEQFNDDYLVRSPFYRNTMNNTVLPWLKEKECVSEIRGYDGRSLYCVSYHADEPVGTVLIVHGFTENAYKYAELIWSLLHLHFSVIAYDQRGHGRSWRDEDVADPSITHVDHFTEYVYDLKMISDTFRPVSSLPFFVFAHSMGGAVVSLFLEQYRDVFSAAVLSSPMIAPHTGGVPAPVVSAVCIIAKILGKRKKNPFFMKTYSGPENFDTSCATDPERFAWYDELKASVTAFQNSVPSYQWSYEALHVTEKILAPNAPEKIACPVLLFSAETDSSVLPIPQKNFIDRVKDGKRIMVKGSRHEIYRSADNVLFPWWQQVISFYRANIPAYSCKGGCQE